MKQFTQLLIFILLSTNLHLSASSIHRNDTIGKFNEVTDIELRLKNVVDINQRSEGHKMILQDTIRRIKNDSLIQTVHQDTLLIPLEQDTLLIPIKSDSIKIEEAFISPNKKPSFIPIVIKTSLDSLYNRTSDGTIQLPELFVPSYDSYTQNLNFRDTMLYNPLFLPVVFTGRIEETDSTFIHPLKKNKEKGLLISSEETFRPLIEKQAFADKVRRDYYLENPTEIKISTSKLNEVRHTASDTDVREKFNPFKELLSSQTSYSLEKPDVEGTKIGRVYWIKSGDHSLQFSQNYFSSNWHQGGSSNLNINNNHTFRANYEKGKVRFNNMLEWRLSLYSAPDDTLRDYRIGNDLLRYYGDFGLDVDSKKRWSYSTNLEMKTQMFTSHMANSTNLRSAFLAPLYVNAGIGMKYNLDNRSKSVRNKRVRLAVSISPLSVNYKYVGNSDVDVKRFGIPEGKNSIFDKGSSLTSQLIYDFTKYVTWTSRIKYFTNYSKVEAEFENTLDMALSRFFSTKLYLHLRYDDGVPADSDLKYLQINEVVSFGLNFKW